MKCDSKYNQKGVTAIEMAFVIPILMMLVFGAIDLARYYMAISILNEAASRALSVARTTANIDSDFRGKSSTSREYYRYVFARNRAIIAASNVALSNIIERPEYTNSMLRLTYLKQVDLGLKLGANESAPTTNQVAAILRPGDCVQYEDGTNYCNDRTLGTTTVPDRSPEFLMSSHPIEVVMRAEVKPFLPFFKGMYPSGLNPTVRTYAFREYIPSAGFAGEPAETVLAAPPADPNKPNLGNAQCREDEPAVGAVCPGGSAYQIDILKCPNPFTNYPINRSLLSPIRQSFLYNICGSPQTLNGCLDYSNYYVEPPQTLGFCSL